MMTVQVLASDSNSPLYLNNILEAVSTFVSLPLSTILPSEAFFLPNYFRNVAPRPAGSYL
jgi:hypothetical protein